MDRFLSGWADAALTTLGFFWMALWAFVLGYVVSSMIQVFVTRERMRQSMGETGPKSVALGTFFGFISSSCSFAALATSKSLFKKGAGFVPALAFLLASTNLVVELGIIIAVFLGWQFVVGEYVGGVILILTMWLVVRLTLPKKLEQKARERIEGGDEDSEVPDWREQIRSLAGWRKVARRYWMEWGMVWKDVSFGFTVAGAVAAFVPAAFFQWLFVGSAAEGGPAWWQTILHTLIGPLAAMFTFIGSMGNIPLAAVLFGSGVSFAGIMAFIFSDLIVFPVLRVNAKYYGWKMSLYIAGVFLACIVVASLALHYGFELLGLIPGQGGEAGEAGAAGGGKGLPEPESRFALDYTLWLNLAFLAITAALTALLLTGKDNRGGDKSHGGHDHGGGSTPVGERILTVLALASYLWLAGGLTVWLVR